MGLRFVDTIITHHGLPSRRTRARWTQNTQKTMRNASALHNFSTLDEPGHCIADSFPRSSCSFDFFSLSDRWMEVEQDISDCSTAILDWKLLVIIYISSIRHKKSIKFRHLRRVFFCPRARVPPTSFPGSFLYFERKDPGNEVRVTREQCGINHYDQACFLISKIFWLFGAIFQGKLLFAKHRNKLLWALSVGQSGVDTPGN